MMIELATALVLIAMVAVAMLFMPPRATAPDPEPVRAPPKPEPKPEPEVRLAAGTPSDAPPSLPESTPSLPALSYEEDDPEVEPTMLSPLAKVVDGDGAPSTQSLPPARPIVVDEDAASDEPTRTGDLILISATGQSEKGLRRKRNEDSVLVSEKHSVFVVADGMGGYAGGEIASHLAVSTINSAFEHETFEGPPHEQLPKRASELARAVQMANDAIRRRAEAERQLEGMGTTICAARFSPKKQRLWVAHVGDSRLYRLREQRLVQITSDHTMQRELGVEGDAAGHLSRALGIWDTVTVDIIVAKPLPDDLYLICSDGLTKMISDDDIRAVLTSGKKTPAQLVTELIDAANENGGKDNISVILIAVADPLRVSSAA